MKVIIDLSMCANKVELQDLVNLARLHPADLLRTAERKVYELKRLRGELNNRKDLLDTRTFEDSAFIVEHELSRATKTLNLIAESYGRASFVNGPTSIAGIRRMLERTKDD